MKGEARVQGCRVALPSMHLLAREQHGVCKRSERVEDATLPEQLVEVTQLAGGVQRQEGKGDELSGVKDRREERDDVGSRPTQRTPRELDLGHGVVAEVVID